MFGSGSRGVAVVQLIVILATFAESGFRLFLISPARVRNVAREHHSFCWRSTWRALDGAAASGM